MRTGCRVRGTRWLTPGFTLLELMVVIAVLGVTFGLSTLAFTSLTVPREADVVRAARRARAEAIRTGRPVAIGGTHAPQARPQLFLPDGRAIGAGLDLLTGAPRDSAR